MRKVLYLLIIPVILAGCAKVKEVEQPQNQEELHEVVFHAGWDPETRTVLQEDGSVWWEPGDEIRLFIVWNNNDYFFWDCKLTSNITEPTAKADFIGQIEGREENTSYIAVYPYSAVTENYYVSGSRVFLTIPAIQEGKEDTFEKDLFVSVAYSNDEDLYFRNICSGVKFSVSTPGIKKVVFSPRSSYYGPISGNIVYDVKTERVTSSGRPTSVTVTAPKESGFEPGKFYYAVLAPTPLPDGINVSYYTDDKVGKYLYPNPIEFKKGVFKKLYEKDKDLTFYPRPAKSAQLYSFTFLPRGVDKSKITDVSFIVNSEKTTEITLTSLSDEPIYFELDGTTAKYYTKAEVYELIDASRMFEGWVSLKNLDLTNVETTFVTDMSDMFSGCYSLKDLDLSGFITSNVTTMARMFAGCSSLKSLDFSSFDTSNVEDMSGMFGGASAIDHMQRQSLVSCSSLEYLDLHYFNTSKVRNMSALFAECSGLKAVDLSGWNTSNVDNLGYMFSGCSFLENVDLSSFDTRNVTDMSQMFNDCYSLKSLDLSNFDTSNVTSMRFMFSWCFGLQSLDIHGFNATNITDAESFLDCAFKMKKLDMGSFDLSSIPNVYSSFSALAYKSKSVAIRCTDATRQIIENCADGYYFDLNHVTWVGLDEPIPDLPDIIDPNLYYSEDFSMDKKVKTLQKATQGRGIDIVIMGEAYSDRLIADGTYERDMREAMDVIFDIEPMKSYQDFFNVYMVYAVSENESWKGSTVFSLYNYGFNSIVGDSYTKIAVCDKPLSDIAPVIVCHDPNAFPDGRSFVWLDFSVSYDKYYDYGQASHCFAFLRSLDAYTVQHEFGHLFAKLGDEYVEFDEAIGADELESLKRVALHTGAYKNIDFTSSWNDVKWNRFLNDSRYSKEYLGVFEGGSRYAKGVWRPTYNSLMNSGTAYNAPSREAIYHRIHKLAYGVDWKYDYETFVQQDLKNIPSSSQSSPNYMPSPLMVPEKHFFKMEKSVSADGEKRITIIMD